MRSLLFVSSKPWNFSIHLTHRRRLSSLVGKRAPRATKGLDRLRQREVGKPGLQPGLLQRWAHPGNSGSPRSHLRGGLGEIRSTLTCRLRPRGEKAGMQQARMGHQNGALLFLSSSGHSQPGWFSSPTARGRRWVKPVRAPQSPGGRPQPRACPAKRKGDLTPWSWLWVPSSKSGNLRPGSWRRERVSKST